MLIKIFIPCLLFFSTLICHGQSDPILLSDYFKNAQKGISSSFSKGSLKELPVANFIAETAPYLRSESTFVRYKAIDLIRLKGILSAPEDRILLVELLVQACKDPDGANSGVASNALLLFNRADFSSRSIDSLVTMLQKPCYFYDRIIRLAGFLNTPETLNALNELKKSDSTLTKKQKWSVELALARSGNRESMDYCMQKITGVPVNDKSVEYLFPDLVYTRQPEAIDFLLQEVLSDEKKCKSSNPDNEENIICAFKILEIIAPVIEEFPIQLTDYGELDIENYDQSLQEIRSWILGRHKYSIILNNY